jgi:hypothetical protein
MTKAIQRFVWSRDAVTAPTAATITANTIECVKPRWPNIWPYGTPAQNNNASTSGSIEQAMAAARSRPGTTREPTAVASAIGTAGCDRIEAMMFSLASSLCNARRSAIGDAYLTGAATAERLVLASFGFPRNESRVSGRQLVLAITTRRSNPKSDSTKLRRHLRRFEQSLAVYFVRASIMPSHLSKACYSASQQCSLLILLLFHDYHPILPFGEAFGWRSRLELSWFCYVEDEHASGRERIVDAPKKRNQRLPIPP